MPFVNSGCYKYNCSMLIPCILINYFVVEKLYIYIYIYNLSNHIDCLIVYKTNIINK
jgi:hypothetical protein